MELNHNTPAIVKTPEAESETPTRIQPTNGVLKRHAPLHHPHHPVIVTYRECLKNFAAASGGHSLDGCGEFMSNNSPSSNPLMCAVCGCHRNFHRRETEDIAARPVLEFQSYNRHHSQTYRPPPPLLPPSHGGSGGGAGGGDSGSPSNSPSPPPISSAYYPSAPHMLMALSHGSAPPGSEPVTNATTVVVNNSGGSSSRKRHRTKFTMDQKGKMVQFAERLGWKMQKKDESVINEFCSEIGVERGVFKVWMHNNKNTVGGKDHNAPFDNNNNNNNNNAIIAGISTPPPGIETGNGFGYQQQQQGNGNGERKQEGEMGQVQNHVRIANGSSSTS